MQFQESYIKERNRFHKVCCSLNLFYRNRILGVYKRIFFVSL